MQDRDGVQSEGPYGQRADLPASLPDAALGAIKMAAAVIVARDADRAMAAAAAAETAVWTAVAESGRISGYMIYLMGAMVEAAKALLAAAKVAAKPTHGGAPTVSKYWEETFAKYDQLPSDRPVHVVIGAALAAVIAAVAAEGSDDDKTARSVMTAIQMLVTREKVDMKYAGEAMLAASGNMLSGTADSAAADSAAANSAAANSAAAPAPRARGSDAAAVKALKAAASAVLAAYQLKAAADGATPVFGDPDAYGCARQRAQTGDTAAMLAAARRCMIYHGLSTAAAKNGHHVTMLAAIEAGGYVDLDAAQAAAFGGHTETMLAAIRAGSSRNSFVTRDAAAAGHRDTLLAAIEAGCPLHPHAAEYAAQGGHTELMIELVQKHGCEWGDAAALAAQYGHRDTMRAAVELGAPLTE